jgi:hypothetical protein
VVGSGGTRVCSENTWQPTGTEAARHARVCRPCLPLPHGETRSEATGIEAARHARVCRSCLPLPHGETRSAPYLHGDMRSQVATLARSHFVSQGYAVEGAHERYIVAKMSDSSLLPCD